MSDFRHLAVHDNIAGIKYASGKLMLLAEVIRATQDTATILVWGLAEGWAPTFYAMGAHGFTSGLVNVFPERSQAIQRTLEAENYKAARSLIDAIAGFEALRTRYQNGANVTVVKEALKMLGTDVDPVRIPGVKALNSAERAELKEIIEHVKASPGSWLSSEVAYDR